MFERGAAILSLRNIRQLDSRRSISGANTQRTGNIFTERAEGDGEILPDLEKDKWLHIRDCNGSN